MSVKNDKESKSLVYSVSKKMQLQIQVQKVAEKRQKYNYFCNHMTDFNKNYIADGVIL